MIELKHLCKTYKTATQDIVALDDINLNIRDGEIFGIIGLSGAGKSTLVRCINLLETPTSGEVLVDGETVTFNALVVLLSCGPTGHDCIFAIFTTSTSSQIPKPPYF